MHAVEARFGKAVRSLSYLVSYVPEEWQLSLSHGTLARRMKESRYRYKGMRRSTKHRRNAQRFAQAQQQIATLWIKQASRLSP